MALARALVVEPRVLLLDEPLSNLDAKVRQRLRVEVRRLQRRVGITAIYVTHDQEEALAIADRVVLMNAGRVIAVGDAGGGRTSTRRSEFAADFLGVGNRLEARAEAGALQLAGQRLAYAGPVRGRAVVVLRSSDLALAPGAPAGATLSGTLEESLFLGAYYRHYVRVGDAAPDGGRPGARRARTRHGLRPAGAHPRVPGGVMQRRSHHAAARLVALL